jgi:replicative DNA helicase
MNDFEVSVIGSILLTKGKALDDLTLAPDDFLDRSNEIIYKTMLEMKHNRNPIDVVTLGARLPKLASYLHDCVTATPTAVSVNFYASKVVEESTRRRLSATAAIISESAKYADPSEVLEKAKKSLDGLIERNIATKPSYVDDELIPYLDELDRPRNYPLTPWPQLNTVIGGLRPGALYIVGARPGVGKTVVGLQLAWHLSKSGPVSFHSLEMGKTELYNRIIAQECEVYLGNLDKGMARDHEWEKIARTIRQTKHELAIHDKSGQTIQQIRALANSVKNDGNLTAIVVDYLGLIQDTEKGRKRYEMITDISIGLKNLARDLEVPVIALAQLNRGPEQRKNSEPDMADLRDSGGIEQDADVVILLHREQVEGDKDWEKSQMIMNVAKNRHGTTNKAWLTFEGHHARVLDKDAKG